MAPIFSRELHAPSNATSLEDDTTKNFISGVTILLALFGKDATNTFLSQSVSILDWVVFAMAPLGVPFAILAVIRTSNMGFLKSLVGLAEDRDSDVEKDLMSSTSEDVFEMWNGEKVVRVIGPSNVSELFFTGFDASQPPYGFYTAQEAKFSKGILKRRHDWTTNFDWELKLWNQRLGSRKKLDKEPEKFYPPNLTLNLGPYQRLPYLWAFTIGGFTLQAGVVTMAGLITFYPPLRNRFRSLTWPFYVFTIGTVLLSLGLIVCASGIDAASQEVLWEPTRPGVLAIWLQEGSDEGNGIASYVISKRIKNETVSSHRPPGAYARIRFPPLIIFCIAVGFLLQAIALPALHWPPQALQFLATMIMFFGRSYLRRQDLPDRTKKIRAGSCKDWIAKMCTLEPQRLYRFSPPDDPDVTWELAPPDTNKNDSVFSCCRCAQGLLEIRKFLASATRDNGQHTKLAPPLAQAISQVAQTMAAQIGIQKCGEIDRWAWQLGVGVNGPAPEALELTIDKKKDMWKADEKELEALISLLLSNSTGHTTVQKRSALFIGPSDDSIIDELREYNCLSDVELYQIPPKNPSDGLSMTIEKDMLVGIDSRVLEEALEEADNDTITFRVSRISDQNQLDNTSGAIITRISKRSLGQLYAQHIFICFMWAIGKAFNTSPLNLRPFVDILSRKVELTGLGDLNFAKLAIIPPLSQCRLLKKAQT